MDGTAQSFSYRISQRLFSNKCSVDIDLPSGSHVRVKGFEHETVARYWLEHEATNFLRRAGHWLDMWPEEKPVNAKAPETV